MRLVFLTILLLLGSGRLFSQAESNSSAPVRLEITALASAPRIPDDFTGLSFEMQRLLPDKDGQYFFRPDHTELLNLFRTLGIKSLRVGGNTADRPTVPFPTSKDIDSFFAFARAAGVKVIFTLRLRDGDPVQAATVAKYIMDHYAHLVTCFALGNEPSVFAKDYAGFRATWLQFADLINSPAYAPTAKFGGPAATAGTSAWTKNFAQEFASSGRVVLATQHIYPGGNADLVKTPAEARDLMLSPEWVAGYRKFKNGFVPEVLASGIPFRLGETNSFWNGGRAEASNTLAAALWALDYMYSWAVHGASGLNFHTGDFVAKGETNTRCMYATFWTTEHGLEAKPLSYALKAFDLSGHGQLAMSLIRCTGTEPNLTSYAVRNEDGISVTLINKEHGPAAHAADVTLNTTSGANTRIMPLITPNGDVSRQAGITLGGATIQNDGSWSGQWSPGPTADKEGQLSIHVPVASALIIKLPLP